MFRVGDLVKGRKDIPYSITSNKSICKVINVYRDNYEDLEVKVIKHETNKECIGNQYRVESQYFVPVMKSNYIKV